MGELAGVTVNDSETAHDYAVMLIVLFLLFLLLCCHLGRRAQVDVSIYPNAFLSPMHRD